MSGDDNFDRLLNSLPSIAEAVNSFQSEEVQKKVFDALVGSLGVQSSPRDTADDAPATAPGDARVTQQQESPPPVNNKPRRKSRAKAPAIIESRDINFRPDGKVSFFDFCEEKKPSGHQEQQLVAIYYLRKVLDVPTVTAGQVLAAYSARSWKKPVDVSNSLSSTSSKSRWINTENMENLTFSTLGENHVEHDMPKQRGKS